MATKREDPGKKERSDPEFRVLNPSWLHGNPDSALHTHAEKARARHQEKLWEDVKRAESQLSITDVPQRKRALERIYADLLPRMHSTIPRQSI